MRGTIISQDQGTYLVSGDDGKRYQFATWDWLGKKPRGLVILLTLSAKEVSLVLFFHC